MCLNWAAEDMVDMVTMRTLECFNCGAEDSVKMVP